MCFPGTQQMQLYQPNEFSYRKQYLNLDKKKALFSFFFFNFSVTLFCVLSRVLESVKNLILVSLCKWYILGNVQKNEVSVLKESMALVLEGSLLGAATCNWGTMFLKESTLLYRILAL